MIKKSLVMIITLIVLFTTTFNTSLAHYDEAYWNETYIPSNSMNNNWMSKIDNNIKLKDISIPGTHDSMAFKSNLLFPDNTRTQSLNLMQQLEIGVRYIDIRAMYDKGQSFPIYHGVVYLGYDLEDVLKTLDIFLKQNPSETVLMRFKQEKSSASDTEMKNLFDKYYIRYKHLFADPSMFSSYNNPTLGNLRGKVLLLSDVLSLNHYGINYRTLNNQDDYHLSTNWDLYKKWEKVKSQLNNANKNKGRSIFVNHLSASGGVFPYFVASGHSNPATGAPRLSTALTTPAFKSYYPDFPRVNWFLGMATIAFEGTNILASDYIRNNKLTHTGIIVSDFIGTRLIKEVINCNFR